MSMRSNKISRIDRISCLSDDLLCKILYLVSTKDAIRTATISKRWKDLWKSVHILDLHDDDFQEGDAYMNFVDGFLELGGEAQFSKFDLTVYWEVDAGHWTSWINTLNRRRIEDIRILNFLEDKMPLPPNLFRSDTLVSLKLFDITLNIPEDVLLPSLKIMHLESMEYADDLAVDRLISSCENLEVLWMARTPHDNTRVLCVRSESLKSFKVEFDEEGENCRNRGYQIVIDTPRLEYLSLEDSVSESIEIKRLGFPAKVDVDVLFDVDIEEGSIPEGPEIDSIHKFLIGISTVNHLIISHDTLKVVYYFWREVSQPPKFYSLSYLEATFEWRMFPALLQSCPNLKHLVLAWSSHPTNMKKKRKVIPECLLTSLEFLEMKTPVSWDAKERKLIKFFLKNSVCLKKVTIRLWSSVSMETVAYNIAKELKRCPRGSTACEVQYKVVKR